MKKTNFDRYVKEQMIDPVFAARFERASEAWEVVLRKTPATDSLQIEHAEKHDEPNRHLESEPPPASGKADTR